MTASPHAPSTLPPTRVVVPSHTSVIEVLLPPVEPGEYTAHLTAAACFRHGLRRSMGATGICWDNSPSESFWSTFKHEEYYRHVFARKSDLVAAVDSWIIFYNTVRRHSAVGMQSPDSYEKSLRAAVA
ncbi:MULTISPECIES: integrase core domain-containing protein [unclassified Rhodococcus (in: high G+C Gram-positive bacteria)]|uniref:integrase core domain-containing protein n=1 Tax=unclassified Rhodococcus (in: high G+C Gram-positive bacteria) TaxID=192944 RepID=UPI0012F63C27|nr:integrase core domain-containing protein [Rhodococcus sp. DK17]